MEKIISSIKKGYKKHCQQIAISVLALNSLLIAHSISGDTISTTDKYAYAENAGWLNFSSTHEQVSVYDDHLEGYVWSEAVRLN